MSMKTVIGNVYNALVAATAVGGTLEYVQRVGKGGKGDSPQWEFPYVITGEVEKTVESLTIGPGGSDIIVYQVSVHFGTKNMDSSLAYYGDATHKGILDLEEDLHQLFRGSMFDGAFSEPCAIIDSRTEFTRVQSGWLWGGVMRITGRKKETRPRP